MTIPVINRRKWMVGTLSGLTGLSLGPLLAEEPNSDLDIIDCHTHFYDPTRPEGIPWPQQGTPLYRQVLPKHLRELKQFRPVTGTVIVEASDRLEDNAWLLELAKDEPFIVGIVGHVDPGTVDFAKHIKRFAANPLFRGIRISSGLVDEFLKKSGTFADLKLLADHDLALDVNGGLETPLLVGRLAKKWPALRFVQNHIGNVSITAGEPHRDWQAGIRAAAARPNVYCKISALVEGAARNG